MADKWILSWNWCSLIVLIAFSCNKAPSPTHPCSSGLTVQCITCMLHSESPRGVGIHVKKYRYVTYYTLILETVSSSNVWVKRMKHIQKLASYKNCTILVLFSWNFVRIIISWGNHFHQVSQWKDKKCGYLLLLNFWTCLVFWSREIRAILEFSFWPLLLPDATNFEKIASKCKDP